MKAITKLHMDLGHLNPTESVFQAKLDTAYKRNPLKLSISSLIHTSNITTKCLTVFS